MLDHEMRAAEQIKALIKGPLEIMNVANGPAEQLKRQMNLAESLGMTAGPAADLMAVVNGPAEELRRQMNLAESLGMIAGPADETKNMVDRMALGTSVGAAEELRNLTTLNEQLMSNIFEMPSLPLEPIRPLPKMDGGLASGFYERLTDMIAEFENSLDDEHEVGVQLVNFGHVVTFHLSDMGHWNPFLIWFEGETDSGDPVKLLQHVNQISVLLMKLPRRPNKPAKRIGFRSSD
jgi:hypothetical protein